MGNFLSICSAQCESTARDQPPAGSTLFFGGTDAEYQPSGIPQRRKAHRIWLSVWNDEQALDRFIASPASVLPQLEEARDVRALKLVPYLRRGAEVLPVEAHAIRPGPDEPIAIVTSLGLYASPAEALAFGQKGGAARESLARADGLLREHVLIPFPPMTTDLYTVTTWRSESAAQAWAYRGDAHRAAKDFYNSATEQPRVSFVRCVIAGSFGE